MKNVMYCFGLMLLSCSVEEVTPKEILKLSILEKTMQGKWNSEYAEIWDNPQVQTIYESSKINCDIQYIYKWDIVKNITIDSLTITSEFFCTPSYVTFFKFSSNKLIESRNEKIIKTYSYIFNSDSTEIVLTAFHNDMDASYFKPYDFPVYKYVLKLKR